MCRSRCTQCHHWSVINDDEICWLDPLIKMALIHHQLRVSIFADGNAASDASERSLLTKTGLLETPILYCEAADAHPTPEALLAGSAE
jgi:hypothetical protein